MSKERQPCALDRRFEFRGRKGEGAEHFRIDSSVEIPSSPSRIRRADSSWLKAGLYGAAAEGIVQIADRHDPRLQGDLCPFQAGRIARSVPALVVVERDGRGFLNVRMFGTERISYPIRVWPA